MIGRLKGVVDGRGDDYLILDVQGVGYQVYCSAKTLGAIPNSGEAAILAIETHVRETEIKLFGFETELEREWFCLLQNVQGVGAKVALAILGALSTVELSYAIASQDKATLTKAPGVGPKVAQRIVLELKTKAPTLAEQENGELGLEQKVGAGVTKTPAIDAVSALTNLGYNSAQASSAVAAVVQREGNDASTATLIRLGLRELSA